MDFFDLENLDIFFNGIFSDECLIVKNNNKIRVIIDSERKEDFNVYNFQYSVDFKRNDFFLNNLEQEDEIIINNTIYSISEILNEYDNIVKCALEKRE